MQVKPLSEILKEYHDFKPGWTKTEFHQLENTKIGSIDHVVICEDSGEPKWDQPAIREKPGSIIVPYFFEDVYYLGIIEKSRGIIEDPITHKQGSIISIEFPMGYALKEENLEETAKRELTEETQAVIKGLKYLGSINPLPAIYAEQKANEVFAAEIDMGKFNCMVINQKLSKAAKKEGIITAKYVSIYEIRDLIKENKIFCGLTQAAFAKFILSTP